MDAERCHGDWLDYKLEVCVCSWVFIFLGCVVECKFWDSVCGLFQLWVGLSILV